MLGGSGKKQASVAAAALLAVASSGQAAGELMAKYEELQGMCQGTASSTSGAASSRR